MGRKKKTIEADMGAPADTTLRAVRLELPEETHRLLRLEAAKQDVSLGLLARIAVEDYLKRKAGEK